jgi:hypothetical protein
MPDFVVGLQVVTGRGKSWWIEKASHPVLNEGFVDRLGAELIRDDDVFNAAVVSFGAFGIITAVAIETLPLYQLKFERVSLIPHADLKKKLDAFDPDATAWRDLYHYEFVFDPYSKKQLAMEAMAAKVPYEDGHRPPDPLWIVRGDKGFAPGDRSPRPFFESVLTPAQKTQIQFDNYRTKCILDNVRCTPGQAFMATITYLEGYNESALGISIKDASAMIEVSTKVIKDMQLPAMSQVRVVHPSPALLGFTGLPPKTCIFEFGLSNNASYAVFEEKVLSGLRQAKVPYTLHWSKNSIIDPARLEAMYGADRIARWRAARARVFENDAALMRVFDNDHLRRAGLA